MQTAKDLHQLMLAKDLAPRLRIQSYELGSNCCCSVLPLFILPSHPVLQQQDVGAEHNCLLPALPRTGRHLCCQTLLRPSVAGAAFYQRSGTVRSKTDLLGPFSRLQVGVIEEAGGDWKLTAFFVGVKLVV